MKRALFLLLMLFLVFAGYAAEQYRVNVSSTLNVRSAPDKNATVLGSVKKGDLVTVDDISGGWAKISFKGSTGYVSSQYISRSTTSNSSSSGYSYQGSWSERMFNAIYNWGFFGYIILYFLIPIVVTVIFVTIPVTIVALFRFLPNWVFLIIVFIMELNIMMAIGGWLLSHSAYSGTFAPIWTGILLAYLTYRLIMEVKRSRCPNCHELDSFITRSKLYRHTTKTKTDYYYNGSYLDSDESTSTSSYRNDLHACNNCGYQWWTQTSDT